MMPCKLLASSPHRLLRFFWLCLLLWSCADCSCADTAVCLPPSGSNWSGLRLAHPNFLPCAAPEKKSEHPGIPCSAFSLNAKIASPSSGRTVAQQTEIHRPPRSRITRTRTP